MPPESVVVNYYDIPSPYFYLRNYVDTLLNAFLFAVAANAGANAFGGARMRVSVPVGNEPVVCLLTETNSVGRWQVVVTRKQMFGARSGESV